MWLPSPLCFVAFLVAACASASDMESTDVRGGKLLPIFQVVKFQNDFCTSTSNSRNGTCYTRWVVQMSLFRLTMDYGHRPITKLNDKLWNISFIYTVQNALILVEHQGHHVPKDSESAVHVCYFSTLVQTSKFQQAFRCQWSTATSHAIWQA